MLLNERLRAAIEGNLEAPAFVSGDEVLSYRGFRALLIATAHYLQEKGVRPGQVIAITMSQSPLHCLVFFALSRLGAVSISVSPIAHAAERAALFRRFDVRMVVSDREDSSVDGVPLLHLRQVGTREGLSDFSFAGPEPDAGHPMRIALTSGTTGEQKGFLQTHDMFARRLDRRYYGEVPAPRVIPPNLHITASIQLASYALTRGGCVVFPGNYDNASFFSAIQRYLVTHVTMPPANLALMLRALPEDKPAFPSIVHLRLMGITPSPAFLEMARRRFSPNIYVPYSMAETGVVALATPEILASVPRSSGRVVPGARLEVLDENGRVVPPGTAGEIRVAVDGMARGYYGRDADSSRFRDGWFYPHDRGYVNADGLVFVEGRLDEILNVGGRKIAPSYAESILEEHAAVQEAAVFPLDEGVEGIRLAAAIVPRGTPDLVDLASFARSRLEIFTPTRFFIVPAIPRNARGKILRKEMQKLVLGK